MSQGDQDTYAKLGEKHQHSWCQKKESMRGKHNKDHRHYRIFK